jgi:protein-S-isoprenylcysteine O-methyltransferase Ste14
MKLSIRASAAFLACPCVVAGIIPLVATWDRTPSARFGLAGLVLLAIGTASLLWCVRDFFVSGRGTLAPWDPPKHLVIVGLYRVVRNPMYLSVLTIVLGRALRFESRGMALYFIALVIVFHLRVTRYEEPWLQRNFAHDWKDYSKSVHRWVPTYRVKR